MAGCTQLVAYNDMDRLVHYIFGMANAQTLVEGLDIEFPSPAGPSNWHLLINSLMADWEAVSANIKLPQSNQGKRHGKHDGAITRDLTP